jgi:hypothetical protein
VLGHQLVVVEDDSVVDAHDGAVANRMVVRLDARVPLRVIAHVDQRLGCARRHDHLVEQCARTRTLLVDRHRALAVPVGVPDSIGAALGDPGEQGLSRERAIHAAARTQAVSGNTTHLRKPLERN